MKNLLIRILRYCLNSLDGCDRGVIKYSEDIEYLCNLTTHLSITNAIGGKIVRIRVNDSSPGHGDRIPETYTYVVPSESDFPSELTKIISLTHLK